VGRDIDILHIGGDLVSNEAEADRVLTKCAEEEIKWYKIVSSSTSSHIEDELAELSYAELKVIERSV